MPDPSKTEKATPKRKEDARKDGQVARSTELNAALGILLLLVLFSLTGPHMIHGLTSIATAAWGHAGEIKLTPTGFQSGLMEFGGKLIWVMLPLFLGVMIVGTVTNVLQFGFIFSPKVLKLKLENLSPIKGFGRMFSRRSLIEFFKGFLKVGVVSLVAYLTLSKEILAMMGLMNSDLVVFWENITSLSAQLILNIGLTLLVLAIIDFWYQKYEYEEQMKMSKQEIKDEHKQMEGDPQIKARIKQVMREASRRRMLADLPHADVVITNPTHLAVAIRYNAVKMDAPRVVAKGSRLLAEKIKEVAREYNIPVMENKPLARAIFKSTAVGQVVPSSMFGAVAELLAFVYQVQGTLARKAKENRARLRQTGNLPANEATLGDAPA